MLFECLNPYKTKQVERSEGAGGDLVTCGRFDRTGAARFGWTLLVLISFS